MEKNILFFGNFKFKEVNPCDGQSKKTRNAFDFIKKVNKDGVTEYFNYEVYKHFPLFMMIKLFFSMRKYEHLVIMPGKKMLIFFSLFYFFLFRFNKKVKINYLVVGGWLPLVANNYNFVSSFLKKISKIHVETDKMVKSLHELGISNVYLSPIFTNVNGICVETIQNSHIDIEDKISFCTYSRVSKPKGINYAIDFFEIISKRYPNIKMELEIFGKIDDNYEEEFRNKISKNNRISYGGILTDENKIKVLSNFTICIFPTYYIGEGFPTTVLECFLAGVPVLCSDWKYNSEIVTDGYNGWLFSTKNLDSMVNVFDGIIEKSLTNLEYIKMIKINCIQTSLNYKPEKCLEKLIEDLNN